VAAGIQRIELALVEIKGQLPPPDPRSWDSFKARRRAAAFGTQENKLEITDEDVPI
jgi:hypothetical protein